MVCVDPVDEQHTRLGVVVSRTHDLVPERWGRDCLVNLPFKLEFPPLFILHRRHEGIRDHHRQIEVPQPTCLTLGFDEGFDVRVVATQCRHHGTAPLTSGHDGLAHGIPDIHEGQRTTGISRHTLHQCTFRPQRREVIADAAALLHGQRGFLEHIEDAVEAVWDRAHGEAVGIRHLPTSSGTSDDPASWQELVVLQGRIEDFLPMRGIGLDRGEMLRNAAPSVLDSHVDRDAVGLLEAILRVPDLFGNVHVDSHVLRVSYIKVLR